MKLSDIPAAKPITIVCHQDSSTELVNDDAGTVTIDPSATLATAAEVDAEAWAYLCQRPEFVSLLRLVFTEREHPELFSETAPLARRGSGLRHTVGLILLTLDAMRQGKRPLWKFPESYLHPAQQLGLADLAVRLSGAGGNGRAAHPCSQ